MSTPDTRREILAALVDQLDGYQFPQPWAFLPPHDDVRWLPADPERLLAALEAEYPNEAIIAAGVAESDGEGRLRIAARLAKPGQPVVVLRDRRTGAVLDLLTEAGSLLGDELPVFTALAGESLTLSRDCGERHVLAAMSLEDVAVLRACGIPATLAAGLEALRPADVERLCAAFQLERELSERLEDAALVFPPLETLMPPATKLTAAGPNEHVPEQAEQRAEESEDGETEAAEAEDREPESDEIRAGEPNNSQAEDSQAGVEQAEDAPAGEDQSIDSQPRDEQPSDVLQDDDLPDDELDDDELDDDAAHAVRQDRDEAPGDQLPESHPPPAGPGQTEPNTNLPDTSQPNTCQPEADEREYRLILVGWSPAALSAEPSDRFHAVLRHFGQLEQFMRVDLSDVHAWRPPPEEIDRVRFFMRFSAAAALTESLLDSIYENAEPLELNRQEPVAPDCCQLLLLSARTHGREECHGRFKFTRRWAIDCKYGDRGSALGVVGSGDDRRRRLECGED